jgi:hypothetical protein
MPAFRADVFADYYQFYVWDAGCSPTAPEDYTEGDVQRLVKVARHVVAIRTVRNTTVPVEVELYVADPGCDASRWDHIVTAPPGSYRVRALFSGLGALSSDGLSGSDRYRIEVWPGPVVPTTVIKQWRGATS